MRSIICLLASLLAAIPCLADAAHGLAGPTWEEVTAKGRGQTVYWNAWAGSEATNDFIAWVGKRVKELYGVELEHVKIKLTAETVSRVVAEKAAGRMEGGSVDLIWINGENFLAMKEQKLLFGPFTQLLPNYAKVNLDVPSNTVDFTVPVDGMESPWTIAQIVFLSDTARLTHAPRSMASLLEWAEKNPGRLTHPQIRNFLGFTFLKQALYEFAPDRSALLKPATDDNFDTVTAPLWTWYDKLKPNLWRGGREFPPTGPAMNQLLADGELDLSFSFSPSEATNLIASGQFPQSVRPYVMDIGTIGNTSFVAIPFNAAHKEAAMLVADFLLSPEAQAKAMDPRVIGKITVLDMNKLSPAERAQFENLPQGDSDLTPAQLGAPLPEPHPSWVNRIVDAWLARYGN